MSGRARGDIATALAQAASSQPGAVRDLAVRAQVGYAAARYTASRMVGRGELVVVADGRPAVLAVPPQGEALATAMHDLHASYAGLPEAA